MAGGHRNIEFVGDSGSGGVKGVVPAPGAGEAGYILTGDATWNDPYSVATGLDYYEYSDNTTITTTSTTPVQATNVTITPGVAGTYLCMFSGSASMNKNSQTVSARFSIDTSLVNTSVRSLGGQAGNIGIFKLLHVVTLTAVQALNVYWNISSAAGGGQGSMFDKTLILIRIA